MPTPDETGGSPRSPIDRGRADNREPSAVPDPQIPPDDAATAHNPRDPDRSGNASASDDETLAAIASSIYRARQRRRLYFADDLFSEPAWDMLLDLFIQKARGNPVTTTSACLGASVPTTTALRMVCNLESKGLVQRAPVPTDRRVSMIELTDLGFRLMRSYVSEGISRDEMPKGKTSNRGG